jgi:hypothetical protein
VAAALLLHTITQREALEVAAVGDKMPTVLACLDASNEYALELLRACGLTVMEDDLRMRLTFTEADPDAGSPVGNSLDLGRPDWVYAMTAPMVG